MIQTRYEWIWIREEEYIMNMAWCDVPFVIKMIFNLTFLFPMFQLLSAVLSQGADVLFFKPSAE